MLREEERSKEDRKVHRLPRIVIVGRANTGKSSLFNRFIKKPLAIVEDRPGVTRDALTKIGYWQDWSFYVTDTGGLLPEEDMDVLYGEVLKSIERAIEKADAVIFLVDGTTEPTPLDYQLADLLRKSGKRVFVAVNKSDRKDFSSAEYYALGFDKLYEISVAHNLGIGELMEDLTSYLREKGFEAIPEYHRYPKKPRVSIVGRPNVGKSSIFNALAGDRVSIVSEVEGTTRDSVDLELPDMIIIDTAGIRRRFHDDLEYYSYVRTSRSVSYADILVAVLDATQKVTHVDKKIVGLAEKEYKGLIVALNKVDLIPKKLRADVFRYFNHELSFAKWAPFVFTSAVTGEGIEQLKSLIPVVFKEYSKQLRKDELYDALEEAFARNKPPVRIYDIKQVGHRPPTFKFVTSGKLPEYYRKYIENTLRNRFGFLGSPIKIEVEIRRKR